MKCLLSISMLLMAVVLMTGAGASSAGIYVDHEKVTHALTKRGPGNNGQIATAPELRVLGYQRLGPSEADVHEKETEVLYVVDGTATIVTGGTVVDGKTTEPGEIRGSAIQGGQTQHLSKGDVLAIPAGTPYWYKEVPQSITYYAVKVLKKMTRADSSSAGIYVDHEKVAHALTKRGPGNDGRIVTAPELRVFGYQRSGTSKAEMHEKETEILYVVDGAATIVTGGTVVGGQATEPGEIQGSAIQGGQTVRLSKGDVLVIPAGTPWWYTEVPQSITYYGMKVVKR